MSPVGRHGLFAAFALLAACGGPEGAPPAAGDLEAPGTVESAVYEAPDSLSGLLGSYSRTWPPAALGELTSMTLSGMEASDRAEGTYVRTVSRFCPVVGCNVETGSYWALPNNPAVGAVIAFADPLGVQRDFYAITQLQRSAITGKITHLVLVKGGSTSPQPFTMSRVGY